MQVGWKNRVTTTVPPKVTPAWRLRMVWWPMSGRCMQQMDWFPQTKLEVCCIVNFFGWHIHRGCHPCFHWPYQRRKTNTMRNKAAASRAASAFVLILKLQLCLRDEFSDVASWVQSSWDNSGEQADGTDLPPVLKSSYAVPTIDKPHNRFCVLHLFPESDQVSSGQHLCLFFVTRQERSCPPLENL